MDICNANFKKKEGYFKSDDLGNDILLILIMRAFASLQIRFHQMQISSRLNSEIDIYYEITSPHSKPKITKEDSHWTTSSIKMNFNNECLFFPVLNKNKPWISIVILVLYAWCNLISMIWKKNTINFYFRFCNVITH